MRGFQGSFDVLVATPRISSHNACINAVTTLCHLLRLFVSPLQRGGTCAAHGVAPWRPQGLILKPPSLDSDVSNPRFWRAWDLLLKALWTFWACQVKERLSFTCQFQEHYPITVAKTKVWPKSGQSVRISFPHVPSATQSCACKH